MLRFLCFVFCGMNENNEVTIKIKTDQLVWCHYDDLREIIHMCLINWALQDRRAVRRVCAADLCVSCGPVMAARCTVLCLGASRRDMGVETWNLDTSCCHSSSKDWASAETRNKNDYPNPAWVLKSKGHKHALSSMFWKSWLSSFSPVFLFSFLSMTCPLSWMWWPMDIFSRPVSESFRHWRVSFIWTHTSVKG